MSNNTINVLALACTLLASHGKITPKAKAPALENAFRQAVAAPTDKRGFVMPKFFWHGVGYPQGCPHGLSHVFNRHAHPLRVKTQPVVPKSRQGATTMQVNPLGHHAPTQAFYLCKVLEVSGHA